MSHTPDLPNDNTTQDRLPQDEKGINRRHFLETGVWVSAGVIGLTLVGGGGRFLVGDALEPKAEAWVKLEEIANLPAGQVHKITYTVRSVDAWRRVNRTGLLYTFSDDGSEYTVLDATCTHLGCNVHWKEAGERFYCACHDAYFSREGAVLSGPPPAPLASLPTKIEDGILFALL